MKLSLSPQSADEYDQFVERDVSVADQADDVLDRIEAEPHIGAVLTNGAHYLTFRVPGRDDLYAIFWENTPEGPLVVRIGRTEI